MPVPSTVSTTRQHALDLAQNLAATGRIEPGEVTEIAEQFLGFLDPAPAPTPAPASIATTPLVGVVRRALNASFREARSMGMSPDEHFDRVTQNVITAVADWLAAQPLYQYGTGSTAAKQAQRDHDERLIRYGTDEVPVSSCPVCKHAPHGEWCPNMASDNDCSCTTPSVAP